MGNEPKLPPKMAAFIAAIRVRPNKTEAAKAAGCSRRAHYRAYETQPAYRAIFDAAWKQGVEALEDEAERRAHTGVRRLVLYHGEVVMVPADFEDPEGPKVPLTEVEYSDQLLLRAMAANKPEKWKDRVSQEVTGENGGPVKTSLTVHFVREPFERADNPEG